MPAPSWPVATQRFGASANGPMIGTWSGVSGRSPAYTRSARASLRIGKKRAARRAIAPGDGDLDLAVEADVLADGARAARCRTGVDSTTIAICQRGVVAPSTAAT